MYHFYNLQISDVERLMERECVNISACIKKYGTLTKIQPSDSDDDAWGKKLEARRMMAILAHTLNNYFEENEHLIPEGVAYWEGVVTDKEEFVEIRRSWEQ